ncbi:hypothetical protein [Lactococcus garvieae]|uniref:hypothetical protein n=1 Tax=Lactococcus garvieae TaxID=1363 RepID=UPI0025512103|nr:hypothetical protein [Lactococcus garvieae]
MDKEQRHIIGQFAYKFEDGSDLYRVGNNPRDFIGVNEKTHKVTIATAGNGATSTCFSQTVNTKPGQKYHLSLDIEPNPVTKSQFEGSIATSEFSEKNFFIACQNEDDSHLVNFNAHRTKKKEIHLVLISLLNQIKQNFMFYWELQMDLKVSTAHKSEIYH